MVSVRKFDIGDFDEVPFGRHHHAKLNLSEGSEIERCRMLLIILIISTSHVFINHAEGT